MTCLFIVSEASAQSFSAQAKIDSLLEVLAQDGIPPRRRISGQLKLVSYYRFVHPDVDSLIDESLRIAEENGFWFYTARSLKFRARYNLYLNEDSDLILDDLRRIEYINRTKSNKLLPGWISSIRSMYHLMIGEVDEAKQYIDTLDHQLEQNKYTDRGVYHTILGMYHQQNKEYNLAFAEYQKALVRTHGGKPFIRNNIGRLHLEMGNPKEAISSAQASMEEVGFVEHSIPRVESHIIIGEAHLAMQDTAKALEFFLAAENDRNRSFYSKNYTATHHLVDLYSANNSPKVDSLLSDLSSFEMIETYPVLLAQKGERYLAQGRYAEANDHCRLGLSEAMRRRNYAYALRACNCTIDVARNQGDKATELGFLRKKVKIQELLNDEKGLKELAKNLASFEAEKDKALFEQGFRKDQEILSEKLKKVTGLTIMGGLLLLIGGFSLYQLRKKNKKISHQNEVISKALKEKDILLREIHHRVKNNLQLVSSLLTLQGRSIDDDMALQAINEGKSRVRSMALIHQDLYNKDNLTGLRVKDYLEKLCAELFSTYRVDQDRVELELEIQDLNLDIDTIVPIGLILNELITNCLKYAFPDGRRGTLIIKLAEDGGGLHLLVKDDGVGYDFDAVRINSFGKTLVSALTDQLDGKVKTIIENGTEVHITFKEYRLADS